ncbi:MULTISPECIES: MFS transporter [Enterobacterales]|uniref:MFS transporter n=1 Tax=Enterobacterales TaxID=91347 RepID=UPI0004236887|nr:MULTISPECIES: MFS transporter [Enterobacterales]KYG17598.1 Multidrug resistance protein stp [Serratia plymuthica]MCS3607366.1 DHA2 family methylenomycin A resistance protein-like MFS transporter [Erwinia rhapontici]QQT80816.1 MFS transporter [Serratia plymuthica]
MEEINLKRMIILTIVSMGFFMVCLDATVVNVALSNLKLSLDTNLSGLQWAITSYTISFAAMLLSAGSLGDRIGPKKVFCIGLIVFTFASVLCGLAQSLSFLVFSRVLQGIGAALLVANSLSILQGIFIDPSDRAKAFGVWGGVGGVAIAVGPVIGGVLIASFGWPSAFFLNIPFGIIGLIIALKYIPEMEVLPRQIKPVAQTFIATALGALAYAFIAAGTNGWHSSRVIISTVVFVLSVLGFVFIEVYSAVPMLPRGIFRSRRFTAATIIGLIINLGFYGQLFVMIMYFQQIKEYSTMTTGFALFPQAVVMAVTAFYCGRVTAKTGPGIPMTVGLFTSLAGLILLVFTSATSSYVEVLVPMLLVGFGMSSTAPATVAAGMSSAPPGQGGITSGVINAARQSGSVMGVAILGSFLGTNNVSMHGIHVALSITVPLYVLALGFTIFWIMPDYRSSKPLA